MNNDGKGGDELPGGGTWIRAAINVAFVLDYSLLQYVSFSVFGIQQKKQGKNAIFLRRFSFHLLNYEQNQTYLSNTRSSKQVAGPVRRESLQASISWLQKEMFLITQHG